MIEVLKSGMYLSAHDQGRPNHTTFGVPESGVMDGYAASFANLVIGNAEHDAVLEVTSGGAVLKFLSETVICVSGAVAEVLINDRIAHLNKAHKIHQSDILKIETPIKGFRNYIAIQGGIQSEQIFASRSMYKPITSTSYLKKGAILPIKSFKEKGVVQSASVRFDARYLNKEIIEVYEGPEFSRLSKQQQKTLLNSEFSISLNSNRMGIRLNEILSNKLEPIITSLVLPGTVQLTPDGTLIILMRDAQTTGGYPRIFQLSENAINSLAQKKFGDSIRFKVINQTT